MPVPSNQHLIHHHTLVSRSTNSDVLLALSSGSVDSQRPYLLTAQSQTAGRGQHGRTWQSPAGNVYLTLYHPINTALTGLLSLMVGYHLTRLPLIQNINRHRLQCKLPLIGVKWANDIGFYELPSKNKARSFSNIQLNASTIPFNKLAGILIEPVWVKNRVVGVVVGVGLNVLNAPVLTTLNQEGMDYCAISLNEILSNQQTLFSLPPSLKSISLKPRDLYRPISSAIIRAIHQFQNSHKNPLIIQKFIEDYSSVDALLNRCVSVQQPPKFLGSTHANSKLSNFKVDTTQTVTTSLQPHKRQFKFFQSDNALSNNFRCQPNSLIGFVSGIDDDGGLMIRLSNDLPTTQKIYTGKIKILE